MSIFSFYSLWLSLVICSLTVISDRFNLYFNFSFDSFLTSRGRALNRSICLSRADLYIGFVGSLMYIFEPSRLFRMSPSSICVTIIICLTLEYFGALHQKVQLLQRAAEGLSAPFGSLWPFLGASGPFWRTTASASTTNEFLSSSTLFLIPNGLKSQNCVKLHENCMKVCESA